jgi:ankyrin repeat protein
MLLGNVINLDFVEYILGEGSDPNVQDHWGRTPLVYAIPDAPGAAKLLLNWPNTEVNITTRSGASFLALVCTAIRGVSDKGAAPDNPEQVQHQLLLQQWCEIEEMLLERGALDTGITTLYSGFVEALVERRSLYDYYDSAWPPPRLETQNND